MPANLFGRDDDVFGDDVERLSGITPPPDSQREKQMRHSSTSSSNEMKISTNKKRQSVSQSIDMLCQKIGKAPMAQSGDGGGGMMFMLQQQHSLEMQMMHQEHKHDA